MEHQKKFSLKSKVFIFSATFVALVCIALATYLAQNNTTITGGPQDGKENTTVTTANAGSPLLLSQWPEFETYWETCDEKTATYEESAKGDRRFYKLRDGYVPSGKSKNIAPDKMAILSGATAISTEKVDSSQWNIALIDCSTGDVSYWKLSKEITKKLEAEKKNPILEQQGFIQYNESRWYSFVNPPSQASISDDQAAGFGNEYRTRAESIEYFKNLYQSGNEQLQEDVIELIAMGTNEDIREELEKEFGKDIIEKAIEEYRHAG